MRGEDSHGPLSLSTVMLRVCCTRCRNLRESENFAVSFGNFNGGSLWVEGTTGDGPRTQTKANNQVVEGAARNTKDSPMYFAPNLHHCVLPWTGSRFGCDQGGFILDDWWKVSDHPLAARWFEFITLITSFAMRGERHFQTNFQSYVHHSLKSILRLESA